MSDSFNHMEAVYYLLQQDATVSGIVGTNIYPYTRPQKSGFPAVVYSQLSEDMIESKDGPIKNGHRFTLEIYADENDPTGGYPKAQSVAKACRDRLQWFTGTVGDYRYRIRFENQNDAAYEEAPEAFKILQDYTLRVI